VTRSILLDGHEMQVTDNLEDTLRHFQDQAYSQYQGKHVLWIDAICINQTDDHEKNHQVRQMFEIYASAARVLVWLGQEGPDSRVAFETIVWTHAQLEKAGLLSLITSSNQPEVDSLEHSKYFSFLKTFLERIQTPQNQILGSLFAHLRDHGGQESG
jgi:hypothetical protein